MKTLILRTFAHPNIWEGVEESCYFESTQKKQILEWEPNFTGFNINDFDYALGIYTDKYFGGYFEPLTKIKKIANTGSDNEKIISKLKIVSKDKDIFPIELNKRIYINIQLESKLWSKPDLDLMLKVDNELAAEKMKEIKAKGMSVEQSTYKPLAYSIDTTTVKAILDSNGIQS